jgi:hypothetical protein
MNMKLIELKQLVAMKRWQEWVNLAMGMWMLVAPMFIVFSRIHGTASIWTAMWTSWLFGGVIIFYSESANHFRQPWKETFHVIIGLCLMISPWILGYATEVAFTRNAVIIGLATTALAIWTIALEVDLRRRHRKHHFSH